MDLTRPDLSRVDSEIRAYIEALEAELDRLRKGSPARSVRARPIVLDQEDDLSAIPDISEPSEPPTTIQIITATAAGIAKRTPRHLYSRQRRGGMGIFDLDTPEEDPASILASADAAQNLILLTSQARAFRLPVNAIPEGSVRAKGENILSKMSLLQNERLVAILPDQAQGYIAMVSQRGSVRLLRHHVFGEHMKPGMSVYDVKSFGPLVSACWAPGDGDLFIATRLGRGIRFSEKSVPPAGGPGIRLTDGDDAVAITAVYPDSGVFMLSADGKGTIRLMEGFTPNKTPGAGGKIAMATDSLIAAATVENSDDIFILSHLSKIIRFQSTQIPEKDGVVQGVICMSLRGDEPTAIAISSTRKLF